MPHAAWRHLDFDAKVASARKLVELWDPSIDPVQAERAAMWRLKYLHNLARRAFLKEVRTRPSPGSAAPREISPTQTQVLSKSNQ